MKLDLGTQSFIRNTFTIFSLTIYKIDEKAFISNKIIFWLLQIFYGLKLKVKILYTARLILKNKKDKE